MNRKSAKTDWVRHGGVAVATIAINAGLIMFMVSWRDSDRFDRPLHSPTVSLSVFDQDTVPDPVIEKVEENDLMSEADPEPVLPAPPIPVMPAPMLSLDTPAPPSIDTVTAHQPTMPLFTASTPLVIAAMPVKVKPAPTLPARINKPDGGGTRIGTSRGPMVIKPPNLADYYPRRARMRGITGRSTIRLSIDDNGRVTNVEIISSSPGGTFETAAGRVGKSLRFRPAIRDGRPVATRITLNLVWNLE